MNQFDFAAEVIPREELQSRIAELGAAIELDYKGRDPLFIVMLNGSVPFAADLVRTVGVPSEVDFLGLNRFGGSGRIAIAVDLSTPVFDRNVILVEDLIDTGLTLGVLRKMMRDRGAASVSTVALLDKSRRRVTDVNIEYRGFEVGDEFLIGYGLDWKGKYRNLPSVWVMLDPERFTRNPLVLAQALGWT